MKYRKIKRCWIILLFAFFSISVYAKTVKNVYKYIKITPSGLNIDIARYCYENNKTGKCVLEHNEIKIKIWCLGGSTNSNRTRFYCSGSNSKLYIRSSLEIKKVKFSLLGYKWNTDGVFIYYRGQGSYEKSFAKNIYDLTYYGNGYGVEPGIKNLTIKYGKPDNLYESFVISKVPLRQAYKLVLERTLSFQKEIARSHQGHLNRYIQSLKDGLAILKDERRYSLLNWRVQESSRRVMIFGIVIAELLDDYSHVERLKDDVANLNTLTSELRKSYGWEMGLAGGVSKASGALLELVELEIVEIAKLKFELGFSNLSVYSDILKAVKKMMAIVNASRSGDMATQREIYDLQDAWNSEEWQAELKSLVEAQADFKKMLSQKLNILLLAMNSISDLTKLDFDFPAVEQKSIQQKTK